MKLLYKMLMVVLVFGLVTSCENTELDLLENPNAISPENASLNDLYNNVQGNFIFSYQAAQFPSGQAARMYHAGSGNYEAFATPESTDGLWINAYSGLFPDVDAILDLADANGFDVHAGTAKIMKAYTLATLVDVIGNVPNSDALKGTESISPTSDEGSAVYAAATALLDEAITQLTNGNTGLVPAYDGFYGGDADQWIKFANSVKLKMALNTGDGGTVSSLASGGNIISDGADDFQFEFGNKRTNPNSRHPFYGSHYEAGDGQYMSNYYMWLLAGDKVGVDDVNIVDPRIRYYFYRKVDDAVNQDPTTFGCHNSVLPDQNAKPAHWEATSPNVPYCVIPGTGYSGRDHLNPQGIPPDGPIRTSYGLYPVGGQFDDDSFEDTRNLGTTGALGQGIWPILLSSQVDLMRAEAALRLGTGEDARALLESAMRASISKAVGFEGLVSATMSRQVTLRDGSSGTIKQLFGTSDEDIDNYVSKVLAIYDAADDDGKLDLVAKEQMIASFGNGLEAYNLYRRTGKPNNMQPGLETVTGEFPRSFLLPAIHVTRNANATQKGLNDRTFWDDGSVELY